MNSCKLKSVTICDFKSYKGKSEITHFYQFTIIIGPNGSGKSNFMDAIAFALGDNWQNLRVNNLLDLIYCDKSQKRAPKSVNSCYVELTFCMDDGNTKNFKRTLFANSQRNLFEIDGSAVKNDEYQAELSSIGIYDFGKNCLVFQEDIESITMQNPKARCKFFERMCGSQNLEEKYNLVQNEKARKEAQAKLIFNDIRSVKREIKILSDAKKLAIEVENLEKNERDLKRNQQLFQLYHKEQKLQKLNETIKKRIEEVRQLGNKKLEAKRMLRDLNESAEQEKISLNELETSISNKGNLLHSQEEILIECNEKIKLLVKKRNNCIKKCEIFENQKKCIHELNRNKELLTNELNNLKKALHFHRLNDDQRKEYAQLKLEAEKEKDVYSRENQIDQENDRLEKCQYRLENENRKKEDTAGKIKFWTNQCQKVLDDLDVAKKNLEKTKKSLAEKEKLRENLANDINVGLKKSNELQTKFDEIVKQLKDLSIEKEYFEEEKEKDKIITLLKNHTNKVFGRLIGLCKPRDSRYEIAFAKIFDESANYIVVETFETVEKCQEILKTMYHNGESFIPLDIIKAKPINEKLRKLKDAEYAFDLLDFPPEIEHAVRFATGDILICEQVETAKILSAGKETSSGQRQLGLTCVTHTGSMFKSNGEISGGSSSVRKLSKRFNEDNFRNLKLKKEQISKELKAASKIKHKKYDLDLLNCEIEGIKKQIQFIEEQITINIEEMEKCETNLQREKATDEEISKAIEELNQELSNVKATRDVKIEEMRKIEDRIFANFCQSLGLENIRVYENVDYLEKRGRIREIQDHLFRTNEDNEKIQNLDGEISKCKTLVNELETKLRTESQMKTSVESQIKELKNEIENIRENIQKVKDEILKAQDGTCREYEKIIQQTSQQIKKIQEEIKKQKNEKSIIKNEMRNIFQHCQTNLISIPLLSGNLNDYLEALDEDSEITLEINYSDLNEDYKRAENEETADLEFNRKLEEIRLKLEKVDIPIRKDDDMLKKATQQALKLKRKLQEKNKVIKKLQDTFENIKTERRNIFESFLSKIQESIDTIYKDLTQDDGAQAFLMPENPEEPYLSGIIYSCIVPGKKYLSMEGLSGGEKTIAAFTLLLAIQKASPASFMFLDEMDAALDFENVDKVANYISRETKQFILISHNEALSSKAMASIAVTKKGKFVKESCIYTVNLEKYRA